MDNAVKTVNPRYQDSAFRRWWNTRTFIQRRMIRLCLTMLMMIICFPLYYLGLFGTVEGPLHPARIGDALAGIGVAQTHILVFLLFVLIIAGTWSWIYNRVAFALGARLTCNRKTDDQGTVCGAEVRRSGAVNRKTGQAVPQYLCIHGHKRSGARFHPAKTGTFSHALLAISLAFIVIILFS